MLNPIEMQHPIVFFDGVCSLCNFFVDWLIQHDKENVFKVASLQGQTAKALLNPQFTQNLPSVVLYEPIHQYTQNKTTEQESNPERKADVKITSESTAVLLIFKQLPSPWRFISILLYIPRPIRDLIYRLIAKYRYQIFGKRETCRLPTPEEQARFLN